MKKFIITSISILVYSYPIFALDGRQFSECFKKGITTVITEMKVKPRGCNELSLEDFQEIVGDLVEWDDLNQVEVPYDEEDMSAIIIKDLTQFLAKKVNCYKPLTSGKMFIHKMINTIPRRKNSELVEKALIKITKEKSPSNSLKALGDVNTSYCH